MASIGTTVRSFAALRNDGSLDETAGRSARSSFGIETSTWNVRLSASTDGLIHVTVPSKMRPGCEATVKRTSSPTLA